MVGGVVEMREVQELPDGSLKCSCGASVKKGEGRNRFRKRHPLKCSKLAEEKEEKREFTKSFLGTKSVELGVPGINSGLGIVEESDRVIEVVNLLFKDGEGINEWEISFLGNVLQSARRLELLSEKRKTVLKRIFDQRL
jgi:hypothetical protein